MAWSKSTRITIMLAIDTTFFILELSVGLAVGSLALMADAFHMLNDIISLVVGLWAVKASQRSSTDKYSFGWLRAEILGAFFNAIFLIALCLTIVLEAITRLVDPPKILNPVLILIVGSLGLASNLAGFIVLGGHGHEHGAEEHDHDHGDDVRAAEEGHNHTHDGKTQNTSTIVAEDDGPIGDVFPEAVVAKAKARSGQHSRFSKSQDDAETKERSTGKMSSRAHKRRSSGRFTSVDDFSIHPASFRNEIIAASKPQLDGIESEENTSSETEEAIQEQDDGPTENSPLLKSTPKKKKGVSINDHDHSHAREHSHHHQDSAHAKHNHNKPRKASKGGHGHNHADMGMNAMILHVMGDALGNVGVIVSALIIWLTNWSGRFYADPAVSLFITLIILRSTIPLTSATAKILLQATPDHIDVNDIKEDIQDIPGVVSCHHVHIWQLSDTQVVASMHIQVAFPISEASGERYMELAKAARECLHAYGIHSATLQPEFCLDKDHDHTDRPSVGLDGFDGQTRSQIGNDECLLECVDDCEGRGCCAPTAAEPEHSHSSHDGHSH